MTESIPSQAASMKDVVRIANLLRDEGDRLLDFTCKLTLTVDFLVKLNEAFDLIVENVETSCFQVINTNNSSIEFLHDLQFLHDFVQKISGLRLWSRLKIVDPYVRLEKFRSLRYLDLHGVSVRAVQLSCLADRLKCLNCTHCNLQDLQDILCSVEHFAPQNKENGSVTSVQHWVLLEEMFLPFNMVEVIGSSLLYVPKLRLLDLSHNSLTDISALEHSSGNLEYLNISFNRLRSIPALSKFVQLKVLLVSDNHLADISGLNRMPSLQQIDASNNLLRDHSCLSPLSNLLRIEKLHLQGNPMAFRRGHRLLALSHLNPLVLITGEFMLDGQAVSPMEQTHLYSMEAYGATNIEINTEMDPNYLSSNNPERAENSGLQNITSGVEQSQTRVVKAGASVGSRQVRIREVAIADEEDCFSNGREDKNEEAASTSAVHLETKRNIERLRKSAGEENWLRGGGGQKMQTILGLPMKMAIHSTSSTSVPVSSSPPSVVEPSLDQVVHQDDGNVESSCDKAEEVQVDVEDDSMIRTDDKEMLEEENDGEYAKEQGEKESGAELGVFVVQKGRFGQSIPLDDLLLRVTDRLLIECNVANGMEVAKRVLCNLVAVSQENVSKDDDNRKVVHLTFRDSYSVEVLSYYLEDEESKELLNLISGMLEMKFSNSAQHAIQLTCLRCSTTFVHNTLSSECSELRIEKKDGNLEKPVDAVPKCPKCNSVAVVQNFLEEACNLPDSSDKGVSQLSADKAVTSKNITPKESVHKDPIAHWAAVNLINEALPGSEAVDHGLHLHILLNILPDGQGKEFDVQKVLVFQGNPLDSFLGHLVISADNIYILKEAINNEADGRRLSGDEHSAPILVGEYPVHNCLSVVKIHSGYLIKFGPEPVTNRWVFPCHQDRMKDVIEALCSRVKEKQSLMDEDQRISRNSKLSEIIMSIPVAGIPCLTGICGPLEYSAHDAEYGILVITSSVIFFVNCTDVETFMFNSEYVPSYERRITDLDSVNGVAGSVHQPCGIILHFSSEEHDDKCMVWPWGDGVILDLLYCLQKPWENIFSVPFETILAQTASEGN